MNHLEIPQRVRMNSGASGENNDGIFIINYLNAKKSSWFVYIVWNWSGVSKEKSRGGRTN